MFLEVLINTVKNEDFFAMDEGHKHIFQDLLKRFHDGSATGLNSFSSFLILGGVLCFPN